MKYLVITRYRHSEGESSYKLFTIYQEAVNYVHKYFLDYDFEVKSGKAFDGSEELDDYEMYNGKVCEFIHAEGDGPSAEIEELEEN